METPTTKDEKADLAALLRKMRGSAEQMRADPRCSQDDNFENAYQSLFTATRGLSKKLTDEETDFFINTDLAFSDQLESTHKDADHLQQLLDNAATTIEVVGAVEKIVKIFHPFLP